VKRIDVRARKQIKPDGERGKGGLESRASGKGKGAKEEFGETGRNW